MSGGYIPHGRPPMPQQIGPPPMGMNRPPPGNESNKLTTLFVGAIAPGVSDAWIEKLLRASETKYVERIQRLNATGFRPVARLSIGNE